MDEDDGIKLVSVKAIESSLSKPNAEERAGFFSRLTLGYMDELLVKGSAITLDDIGAPRKSDQADEVLKRFEKIWAVESLKKKPNLFSAQLRSIDGGRGRFATAVGFFLIEAVLQLVPVLCLRLLVSHFETTRDGKAGARLQQSTLWSLVALLYLAPTLGSAARARFDVEMIHAGCEMWAASSLALYKKSLKVLAPESKAKYSTGNVVNLFSSDAFAVQRLLLFIGVLFSGPVQIALCLFFIWRLVGEAVWVGLAFMVGCVPLQVAIFVPFLMLQKAYLRCSDERTKLVNEVLTGIRIIKFLAWEKPFIAKLGKLRDAEAKLLWRQAMIVAFGFTAIMLGAPIVQPVVLFTYYTREMGRTLDASTAFSTLALFSLLRLPLTFLPFVLITYLSYKLSCRRISDFLTCRELEEAHETPLKETPEVVASFDDASFSWGGAAPTVEEEKKPLKKLKSVKVVEAKEDVESPNAKKTLTLEEVSLQIKRGSLVGVVGPVGSGKSSLIAALMGEMERVSGVTRREDAREIAFATQVPWVLNATLLENVTFGSPFDSARFEACLVSCALSEDVKTLPGGTQCEIGERGVNLSGGQKARVALARACYSRADLCLLDDPLSAVDSHVCQHLVDHVIDPPEHLTLGSLAKRTRLLVTHHAAVLPRCDLVVVVKSGKIVDSGTYEALAGRGVDMGELQSDKDAPEELEVPEEEEVEISRSFRSRKSCVAASLDDAVIQATHTHDDKDEVVVEAVEVEADDGALVVKEAISSGTVSTSVFAYFIKAGGSGRIGLALLFIFGGKASELAGQFYLADYSQRKDPQNAAVMRFIYTYLMYSLIAVAGLTIRAWALACHRVRAANAIHHQLVERVLKAPTSFFDVTPVGRILNRFGSDMLTIDTELSRTLTEFSGTFMFVLGAIVAIAVATRGVFLILAVPLLFVYRKLDVKFRHSSTSISRLTKLARSPVIADFAETLSGVSTVRAYGQRAGFLKRLSMRCDALQSVTAAEQQAFSWLAIRLDQLAAITSCGVGALAVGSGGSLISAQWLGLALMASIEVSTFLKSMVRLSALLAGNMASVERISEYVHHVPQECAKESEAGQEDFAADKGEIVFEDVALRYRPGLPLVLNGLSFRVEGGSKVGIVGRTGSGKSSIANALWRIVEPNAGTIRIDGVATSTLSLFALRRACFIIPQDPVLFTASARFNLDPFDEYSTEQIWDALSRARLAHLLMEKHGDDPTPEKALEFMLQEGGSNLSVGQRQLLCIARAMLRKPKIVMLDEATASIDNETDTQVQLTLRETFKDSTTLTIAHRLHTILDADVILVLDAGRVVEQGTPTELLKDPNSTFSEMAAASKKKTKRSKSKSGVASP